jgi:hypothetical protein
MVNFFLASITRNLIIERELGLLEDGGELDAMMEHWFRGLCGADELSTPAQPGRKTSRGRE